MNNRTRTKEFKI